MSVGLALPSFPPSLPPSLPCKTRTEGEGGVQGRARMKPRGFPFPFPPPPFFFHSPVRVLRESSPSVSWKEKKKHAPVQSVGPCVRATEPDLQRSPERNTHLARARACKERKREKGGRGRGDRHRHGRGDGGRGEKGGGEGWPACVGRPSVLSMLKSGIVRGPPTCFFFPPPPPSPPLLSRPPALSPRPFFPSRPRRRSRSPFLFLRRASHPRRTGS